MGPSDNFLYFYCRILEKIQILDKFFFRKSGNQKGCGHVTPAVLQPKQLQSVPELWQEAQCCRMNAVKVIQNHQNVYDFTFQIVHILVILNIFSVSLRMALPLVTQLRSRPKVVRVALHSQRLEFPGSDFRFSIFFSVFIC